MFHTAGLKSTRRLAPVDPLYIEPISPEEPIVENEGGQGNAPREMRTNENNEAIDPRTVKNPRLPSREEVRKHMLTRLPYRSWCTFCVMAKSKSRYTVKESTWRDIPLLAIDLMFLGYDELDDEDQNCNNSANFQARSSRLCMVIYLENT